MLNILLMFVAVTCYAADYEGDKEKLSEELSTKPVVNVTERAQESVFTKIIVPYNRYVYSYEDSENGTGEMSIVINSYLNIVEYKIKGKVNRVDVGTYPIVSEHSMFAMHDPLIGKRRVYLKQPLRTNNSWTDDTGISTVINDNAQYTAPYGRIQKCVVIRTVLSGDVGIITTVYSPNLGIISEVLVAEDVTASIKLKGISNY